MSTTSLIMVSMTCPRRTVIARDSSHIIDVACDTLVEKFETLIEITD